MKKTLLAAFTIVILAACGKDSDRQQAFQAHGTLTYWDPSYCPTLCCGGIYLTIDNDPAKYKIHSLPNLTMHQLTALTLPKRISFNYQQNPITCPSGLKILDITQYKLY